MREAKIKRMERELSRKQSESQSALNLYDLSAISPDMTTNMNGGNMNDGNAQYYIVND